MKVKNDHRRAGILRSDSTPTLWGLFRLWGHNVYLVYLHTLHTHPCSQLISHKPGHQKGKDLGLLIWYQLLHLAVDNDLLYHIVITPVFSPHAADSPKTISEF